MQKNNDARVNAQFASLTDYYGKKGIDETWLEKREGCGPDKIIIRYDVLLMYAEAKIELNRSISRFDAINQVRARAYGVDYTNAPILVTTTQPAATTDDPAHGTACRVCRRIAL